MTGKGQTAVSGMKKLDDVRDAQDWQTVNLNFVLTSKVRSVSFLLVARTHRGSPTKTRHYVDDVQAMPLVKHAFP
jgi:hypothetical protein